VPTTVAAARDFAKNYPRGSRLASSAFQGDPGPTPFRPGEVTPGATVVKFAQLVLGEGARRRREMFLDAQAKMAAHHQTLVDQELARRSDPNYMSPFQRESLDLSRQRLEFERNKPATESKPPADEPTTPEIAAAAGHGIKPGPNDPRVVQHAIALTGQEGTDRRARETAKRTQEQRSKVAQARFEMAQINEGRQRVIDQAEQVASDHFDQWYPTATKPIGWFDKGIAQKAASDSLGTSREMLSASKMTEARSIFLAKHKRIAATQYDQSTAARRMQIQSVIDSEMNLPPEADTVLDWNGSEFVPATDK
jgi:hypothetical protein